MQEPGTEPSRFTRVAPYIAIPLLLLVAAVQVRFALMGDKGWLLYAAEKWVSGKKLYVDIFEVNPPLIIWIYSVAVRISQHLTFVTDYEVMGIMGLIALCIVLLLCRRLLASHPAFAEDEPRRRESLLLVAAVLLFVISPVYFFDREYIMLALTLPYILRFTPELARMRFPTLMRILIGALAAAGFSIKPHAVVVFACVQVFYLVRDRSPRILASVENIVIYLLGLVYLALVFTYTPEYFTTVLPMALQVYASYNVKGSMHYYLPLAFLSVVVPLLDFRPRYETPFRGTIYSLLALSAIYFGYALVNNGWGYTYQPFFSILTLATGWLYWEYEWLKRQHVARSLPSKQFDVGLKGCLYCLTINGVLGVFTLHALLIAPDCGGFPGGNQGCVSNTPYVDSIKDKHLKTIGVMSGEFTRWPLISWESGAPWVTRFNHLWMVPGLMKAQTEKATSDRWDTEQWIVNYVAKAYADDFTKNKPDGVFVDNSDEFFTYGHHVDLLALLGAVPEFKKAWTHYHYDSTIDKCKSKNPDSPLVVGCRYDLYVWKKK